MSTRSLRLSSAGVRHADAELLADGEQELRRGHARIEDQRDLGVLRRLRQERAHDGGLAGADLAGELHEAAGLVDAVQQVRQRLGVPLAQVQVARIGRDRERLFVEAEERQVHASDATRSCCRAAAPGCRSARAPRRASHRGGSSWRVSSNSPSCDAGVSSVRTTPSRRSFAPRVRGQPAGQQLRGHPGDGARLAGRRRHGALAA